jgi:protein-disulfide isomerase-like protein with CxxC motif
MRDLFARLLEWCLNPRCTWCGGRTPDLEAHMRIEHAGDGDAA